MIKELKYNGLSANPSDHESPDGDLTTALNLIPEDGQIKPLFQPKELAYLPDGYTIVFIHKHASFTHYIVQHENTLLWFDGTVITGTTSAGNVYNNLNSINHDFGTATIYSIKSFGKTLVVTASDGNHYIIWTPSSTPNYVYRGQHLPELDISFSLHGVVKESEEKTVAVPESLQWDFESVDRYRWLDERFIDNSVLGAVNEFIAEQATNQGKFIFPFFVRYAYRLYDGTLSMHSSPVLMITDTGTTPRVPISNFTVTGGTPSYITGIKYRVKAPVYDLEYQVLSDITNLVDDWGDIIQSVDVFISAPIYKYNQAKKVESWLGYNSGRHEDDYCVALVPSNQTDVEYKKRYIDNTLGYPLYEFQLTEYDNDIFLDSIRECSLFYLLKSFKLNELSTSRTAIYITTDYLSTLVSREVMSDDYDSHYLLSAKCAFEYNARLCLADITKKQAFMGEPAAYTAHTYDGDSSHMGNFDMCVIIRNDSGEFRVQNVGSSYLRSDYERVGGGTSFVYFYYPDPNAYALLIGINLPHGSWPTQNVDGYYLPLTKHDNLNGAYYFNGWAWGQPGDISVEVTSMLNRTDTPVVYDLPNRIYVSEINNPFFFPVTSIVSVGTGTVLAVSSVSQALSQGQFGQFPLYVFSTEGVWVLEVSSTGQFTATKPVTRDVCTNPDSITQLDNAILFATDRGIMHIAGSQATCITDVLSTEHPFNVLTGLQHASDLHALLGHGTDTCLPTKPFLGFLSGCRMTYDYLHQRIYVFNPKINLGTPQYTYAYVFSLKSKMWGMVFSDLTSPLNSYPDALAMARGTKTESNEEVAVNRLVTFSATDETESKGMIVTRPLKFGGGDILKTVRNLLHRGNCARGDVKTVLYGSRDLVHWHIVGSSTNGEIRNLSGTPYKYFRIAAVTTFAADSDKSLFGCTVELEPRYTDTLH